MVISECSFESIIRFSRERKSSRSDILLLRSYNTGRTHEMGVFLRVRGIFMDLKAGLKMFRDERPIKSLATLSWLTEKSYAKFAFIIKMVVGRS